MKLQLNFQIVRFLNYKQRFSDALPRLRKQTRNRREEIVIYRMHTYLYRKLCILFHSKTFINPCHTLFK